LERLSRPSSNGATDSTRGDASGAQKDCGGSTGFWTGKFTFLLIPLTKGTLSVSLNTLASKPSPLPDGSDSVTAYARCIRCEAVSVFSREGDSVCGV
jgi:hypothetical protein